MLLDGQNIHAANNSNYAYFNSPKYNKMMTDASKLSGPARYDSYGKLDVDLKKNAAPWATLSNGNVREFISGCVSNYLFHPVYGGAIMNALALRWPSHGDGIRRSGSRPAQIPEGSLRSRVISRSFADAAPLGKYAS